MPPVYLRNGAKYGRIEASEAKNMDTLDFILKRYNLTLNENQFLVPLRHSRWREMPLLFKDLGFTKGVEVGVYRGRFSTTLCAPNPDLALIGVDAWDAYDEYKDYDAEDMENAFFTAKERTRGYNIALLREYSLEASKRFADESLDFVFIDANHDYEYAVNDIAAWSKKVRKGGLVCGHDYVVNTEFNFGVIEAVNGWCASHHIKPLFLWRDKCPSWMYVKE
ncbi:MAG: class I SAM-dependent methyltransferase [Candidatus Paceibacterota bacterium]|jgi:hypothetical protein